MKARVNSIALVGWLGIEYLEITLDDGVLTGLIGMPGAGKTTIALCACYALLPDRQVLKIKPLSDVSDPHRAGVDTLAGRVDPNVGFAYVLLDIQASNGSRVIAGIHVRVVDGNSEFTRMQVESPPDWPLQDFLRVVEGDEEAYVDYSYLATSLARRGVTLRECRTVREYGEVLYNAGIAPCDLSDASDRALYARLIESTFRGGLTAEVASNLKEYLLPPAARIPESIGRLQKCADSMLRTRSALDTAEQQLHLLESTFGLGKKIVSRALGHIVQQVSESGERKRLAEADHARHEIAIAAVRAGLEEIGHAAESAERTKESIESQFEALLNACIAAQRDWRTKQIEHQEQLRIAQDAVRSFDGGRRVWAAVTEGKAMNTTPDELAAVLAARVETAFRQKVALEHEHRQKTEQRNALAAGAAESSAALAEAFQAQSLEEALDDVPEGDARALEMALGGVVDGLLGTDVEALSKVRDDDSLPHTFWLRTSLPVTPAVHKVGDWYATTAQGGFLVTSSRRRLTLGKQARANEVARIEGELASLKKRISLAVDAQETAQALRDKLIEHKALIAAYLSNVGKEKLLHEAVDAAKVAVALASDGLATAIASQTNITDERKQKTSDVDAQLVSLAAQKQSSVARELELASALGSAKTAMSLAADALTTWSRRLETVREQLGSDANWLYQAALDASSSSHDSYISSQASDLTALGHSLADEPGDRMAWLVEARAADAASCCAIWMPLKSIVSDRISVDLLDGDGADLIGAMADRRRDLSLKLVGDRAELRSEAKSLYSVITTEIRKQERRVKALSQFGEVLQFGNVTGMRIRAEPRKEMLDKLHAVTDEIDFFAEHSTVDLDHQLAELFEKTLSIKLGKGQSLLDYRTYLDLYIEAQRGKWGSAISLSGGESIGGGLAIALILAKSLSLRGADARTRGYTPFFVVDEIQRLNAEGQGVIVKFGHQQGMQILVTALSLDASYDCTMYALTRLHIPKEEIVARRLQVRRPLQVGQAA